MKHTEKSLVINAPLTLVYDQWTQFETFPFFMPDLLLVRQLDEQRVLWRAEIWGCQFEWEAKITEQVPDSFITWRSIKGVAIAGTITFDAVDDDTTKVTISMDYEPHGLTEWLGHAFGVLDHTLETALFRFKIFIEGRSRPTGHWRGEIHEALLEPAYQA